MADRKGRGELFLRQPCVEQRGIGMIRIRAELISRDASGYEQRVEAFGDAALNVGVYPVADAQDLLIIAA